MFYIWLFYMEIPFHSVDFLRFCHKHGLLFRSICFHLFSCTISVFKTYCFQFSIQTLWCFLWYTNMFSLFIVHLSFYICTNLYTQLIEHNEHLPATLYCGLFTWMILRSFHLFQLIFLLLDFLSIECPSTC